MNLIFITGTAGAGKSLLTSTLQSWYRERSQDTITVNLDPGVLALPYDPDVDVRTLIDLEQIMNEYSLGPNGALVFANDLIAGKLAEIQEEIDSTNADFVVVDTPGQVELFAFRESGPFVARGLQADSKVLFFLIDPLIASTPTNFLSLALLSAAVQLRMNLPQIQVLSKADLAKEDAARLAKWSRNPAIFEEALSKTRSGEVYFFYSEIFRALKKASFSLDLYPVSAYTRDGLVALVGEVSRIMKAGDEFED